MNYPGEKELIEKLYRLDNKAVKLTVEKYVMSKADWEVHRELWNETNDNEYLIMCQHDKSKVSAYLSLLRGFWRELIGE